VEIRHVEPRELADQGAVAVKPSWPALRIAAAAELISLAVLLINLATVHWRPVASRVAWPPGRAGHRSLPGARLHRPEHAVARFNQFVGDADNSCMPPSRGCWSGAPH